MHDHFGVYEIIPTKSFWTHESGHDIQVYLLVLLFGLCQQLRQLSIFIEWMLELRVDVFLPAIRSTIVTRYLSL